MKKYVLLTLLVLFKTGFANEKEDSLKNVIATLKDDSLVMGAYNNLAKIHSKNHPELAVLYTDTVLTDLTKNKYPHEYANALLHRALAIRYLGDYAKALELSQQALKIYQEHNHQKELAGAFINIGVLYWINKDYEKAKDYYTKATKVFESLNDPYGLASCYINLGILSAIEKKYEQSEAYFIEGSKQYLSIADKDGATRAYNNLAQLGIEMKNYKKAQEYVEKALKIRIEIEDHYGIASSKILLGTILISENKLNEALINLKNAYDIGKERNISDLIKDASMNLSTVYDSLGAYQKSLEYYKIYSQTKDSLFNESKSKEIGKLEAKYEMENKIEEERRNDEIRKQKLATKKQRRDNLQYSGIFVFVLILFLAVFMSGKIAMRPKVAEGLIFFSFLLFFEFCLVLVDPFVDEWSEGEPAYKLLMNAVLAGGIFPLHAFFEDTIKKKIFKAKRNYVRKNKQ